MKSTTWDYDKKLITEWLRLGSCNRCGECCKTMIHFTKLDDSTDGRSDGETHVSEEGVWHEWEAYGRKRYWQVRIDNDTPCDCYAGVGKACHDGSPCKGLICTAWPLHPDHVACFDNCSFKFVKLDEWEMTDNSELMKENMEKLER